MCCTNQQAIHFEANTAGDCTRVSGPPCYRCAEPATGFFNVTANYASSVPSRMEPVCDGHNPYAHVTLENRKVARMV